MTRIETLHIFISYLRNFSSCTEIFNPNSVATKFKIIGFYVNNLVPRWYDGLQFLLLES
jgi:hypothetical protein